MKKTLIISALCCALMSCTQDVLYSHFENIPNEGWNADSTLSFNITLSDSATECDVIIDIRHNRQYPYQNIWLMTDIYADSALLLTDTLEYYLANQRGEWLGNGFGRLKDMPGLWLNNTSLSTHNLQIKVRHGMRTERLTGVEAIGITIEKR